MMAAIEEMNEAQVEKYRVAAYPVFLTKAKKGTSWAKFLKELNLDGLTSGARSKGKLSKDALATLYARAEKIKQRDQKR